MYLGIVKRKAKRGPVPITRPIPSCEVCGALDCRHEVGAGGTKMLWEKPKTNYGGLARHQKPVVKAALEDGESATQGDGDTEFGSESTNW